MEDSSTFSSNLVVDAIDSSLPKNVEPADAPQAVEGVSSAIPENDPPAQLSDDDSSSDSSSDSESSSSSSSSSFMASLMRKRPGAEKHKSSAFTVEPDDADLLEPEPVVDDFDDGELDEDGPVDTGPPRTVNEVEYEEKMDFPLVLPPEASVEPLGSILHIVDDTVVIKMTAKRIALDLESLLSLQEGGKVLGRVSETFGPVDDPLYSVRLSTKPPKLISKPPPRTKKPKSKHVASQTTPSSDLPPPAPTSNTFPTPTDIIVKTEADENIADYVEHVNSAEASEALQQSSEALKLDLHAANNPITPSIPFDSTDHTRSDSLPTAIEGATTEQSTGMDFSAAASKHPQSALAYPAIMASSAAALDNQDHVTQDTKERMEVDVTAPESVQSVKEEQETNLQPAPVTIASASASESTGLISTIPLVPIKEEHTSEQVAAIIEPSSQTAQPQSNGYSVEPIIKSELPEDKVAEEPTEEEKERLEMASKFYAARKALLSILRPGMLVNYVVNESSFVNPAKVYVKGYDASDMNDEELPSELQEFSDDEAEREASTKLKQQRKRAREEKMAQASANGEQQGQDAVASDALAPPPAKRHANGNSSTRGKPYAIKTSNKGVNEQHQSASNAASTPSWNPMMPMMPMMMPYGAMPYYGVPYGYSDAMPPAQGSTPGFGVAASQNVASFPSSTSDPLPAPNFVPPPPPPPTNVPYMGMPYYPYGGGAPSFPAMPYMMPPTPYGYYLPPSDGTYPVTGVQAQEASIESSSGRGLKVKNAKSTSAS